MLAYDVVLCNKTEQEDEKRLEICRKVLEKKYLNISRKKTEYLFAGGEDARENSTKLQNVKIPKVTSFKYLGSTQEKGGGSDIDVGTRLKAEWYA